MAIDYTKRDGAARRIDYSKGERVGRSDEPETPAAKRVQTPPSSTQASSPAGSSPGVPAAPARPARPASAQIPAGPRPAHRRRGARVLLRLAAALFVLGGAGYGAWWYAGADTDPERVALPPAAAPAEAEALAGYFAKGGAPVVAFAAAVPRDLAVAETDGCAALARDLEAVAPPPRLLDAASGAPDTAVRDAAVNGVETVVRYVGACRSGDGVKDAREEAEFAVTVLRRVLSQNGVSA